MTISGENFLTIIFWDKDLNFDNKPKFSINLGSETEGPDFYTDVFMTTIYNDGWYTVQFYIP